MKYIEKREVDHAEFVKELSIVSEEWRPFLTRYLLV